MTFLGILLLQNNLTFATLRKMLKFVRIENILRCELKFYWNDAKILRLFTNFQWTTGSTRDFNVMDERLLHPNLLSNDDIKVIIKDVSWCSRFIWFSSSSVYIFSDNSTFKIWSDSIEVNWWNCSRNISCQSHREDRKMIVEAAAAPPTVKLQTCQRKLKELSSVESIVKLQWTARQHQTVIVGSKEEFQKVQQITRDRESSGLENARFTWLLSCTKINLNPECCSSRVCC